MVTRIDTTTARHLFRGVLGATVVDLAEPTAPTFHLLLSRDQVSGEVYVRDAVTGEDSTETSS